MKSITSLGDWTIEKGRLACQVAILAKLIQKQMRTLDAER